MSKSRKALETALTLYKKNGDKIKKLYAAQDELLVNIQGHMEVGFENGQYLDAEVAVLNDNFADKNATFRTVCVRRFELDFIAKDKFIKKLETLRKKDEKEQ